MNRNPSSSISTLSAVVRIFLFANTSLFGLVWVLVGISNDDLDDPLT